MKPNDKQYEVEMITDKQSRDDFGNASFNVCNLGSSSSQFLCLF